MVKTQLTIYTNQTSKTFSETETTDTMKTIFVQILLIIGLSPIAVYSQTVTLDLQPDSTDAKDAYVSLKNGDSGPENTNYGSATTVLASAWLSGANIFYRFFVQFDLSTIPKEAEVQSATLYLYSPGSGNGHSNLTNSNACYIERVTQSWAEHTITHANSPPVTTDNRASIPEESSQYADHNIDVTALYQDIISQADSNRYGIRIILQSEVKYNRMKYRSSDDLTNSAKVPRLVIVYKTMWLGTVGDTTNIYRTGPVSLGDSTSVPDGYLLSVDGKIICEEINVKLSANWPDYVFDEGYQLMNLEKVESYINEYHHLPGMPSAEDIKEEGVDVSEMMQLQMQKIEELTLHVIEQGKEYEAIREEIKQLKD